MTPRRRGGASTGGGGMHVLPCAVGFGYTSMGRFGSYNSARRVVWPPVHMQIAHPSSLGMAPLYNVARSNRARASYFGGFLKGAGGRGGVGGGGNGGEKDDAVSKLIDEYGDKIGEIGFAGVVGFVSGYAMMKAGKTLAFFIGLGFIVTQGLNYAGVVTVKWNKAEVKFKSLLGRKKDGKVDKEDVKAVWMRAKAALTHNLPAGGGFTGGFTLGLYCG